MPRKPTETVQVNLRMKEGLRRRLEREAQKQSVSLNAEMTRRLETSISAEERVADLVGGEKNLQLFRVLGPAIARIEAATGKPWEDDVATFVRVSRSIVAILQGFWHLDLDPSELSVDDAFNEFTKEFPTGGTLASAAMAGRLLKRIQQGDEEEPPQADPTDTNPEKQ
jgi:hypothetical protein